MPRRVSSFSLCLIFAALLMSCQQVGVRTDEAATPAPRVPLHRVFERSITNSRSYPNKFTDVLLNVEYIAPSGKTIRFPGFYDGDGSGGQSGNVWKIRFMPTELGEWRYTYSWSDGAPGESGRFSAVAAGAGPGVLKAYSTNPHWFAYNGDAPVFLKSYYIITGGFTGVPIEWAAPNVYAKLAQRGYNHVQLNMLPLGWTEQRPADAPADHLNQPLWRETPRVQNLALWRRMEQHVQWLNHRNIGIHFFMGFDPKPNPPPSTNDPYALKRFTEMSPGEQVFYVRYVTARLAPFANIAGWNYTWETDGSSGEIRFAELLAQYDPWGHLATYHDEAPWSNRYDSPKFSFAAIENHEYFGNRGGERARDSASHYQATLDAYRNKPVYMTEGNGLWRSCHAGQYAEVSITRSAWAVTLAGGSFTWDDVASCDGDSPASSMFTWPAGTPMVDRLEALYQVMTRDVTFHHMKPRNDLLGDCWATFSRNGSVPTSPCFALAEAGKQYVVYKENGGSFSLNVDAGVYDASWIDTHTGARQAANGGTLSSSGGAIQFSAPSTTTDWVLLVKSGE